MKNQPYRKTLADDGTIEGSVEKRHDGLPGPGNGRVSSSCLFPNILKFVHQHTEAGGGAASVCVFWCQNNSHRFGTTFLFLTYPTLLYLSSRVRVSTYYIYFQHVLLLKKLQTFGEVKHCGGFRLLLTLHNVHFFLCLDLLQFVASKPNHYYPTTDHGG